MNALFKTTLAVLFLFVAGYILNVWLQFCERVVGGDEWLAVSFMPVPVLMMYAFFAGWLSER